MNPEFVLFLLGIGAFLTGVILVWIRFRTIERQLGQMRQDINELRWMESRLFMLGMKAPKANHSEADSGKGAVRQDANTGAQSAPLISRTADS
jgi:hypothetical protein